jgi:hypothetical protein
MKWRVETGTDIAMLGAWDRSRNNQPMAKRWGKEFDLTLEADAVAGHLFLIHTGADCGGPVEVLIDEEMQPELRDEMIALPGKFLLRVPTGRLVVGGVEDYRSTKPRITDELSDVRILAGDYVVESFTGPEENIPVTPTNKELKQLLGEEDFHYYNRVQKQGCLTLLLFPALWPFIGWKLAAGITVLVVFGYFYINEKLFLRRNKRYQQILKTVNEAHAKAGSKGSPIFLFQLLRVDAVGDLKGGSIDLRAVAPHKQKT